MSEYVAYEAVISLANGLRLRAPELLQDAGDPQSIVSRALAHIDRLDTALDEALDAEPEGLSEQHIRAAALDVAGRKFGTFGYDTEELLDCAETLAGYIRDGSIPPRVSAEERSDDKSNGSSPSTDIEVG